MAQDDAKMGQVFGAPYPMRAPATRDEYVAELCLKNGITPDDVAGMLDIEPCDCNYAGCSGWLALPKKDMT